MPSSTAKISFYFPKRIPKKTSKHELVSFILKEMEKKKRIQYAGYLEKKDLKKDLIRYVGNPRIYPYKTLGKREEEIISDTIKKTVRKCNKVLPHPYPPIFIFVYPWFPNKKKSATMEGVNAFVSFHTVHLFLDINSYNNRSLEHTIAHEWNHLVFYKYHQGPYALKDHLFLEGAAEVFREEVLGGNPAPWSIALKENEIKKQLTSLKPKLSKKGLEFYREVFFGNKKYKQWTGYSIGYWLVKNFREKHKKLTWKKIIRMKSEDILASFPKNKV
jgi:uncharacterized protein YjaZ